MLKFISGNRKTVLINATNVGYKMNGIGNYTLNLIKHFTKLNAQINFIIYFNESSRIHIKNISFPENFEVRWVSKWMSPDNKFLGHLLRLMYSNYLALKHFRLLQFNTSPLEICFFKSNQVVTVHDVIPILFKKLHKKQYHFYKVILKYVLRYVQMVITPSLYTKELVHKYYGLEDSKVKNIPLAIEPPSSHSDSKNEQQAEYILYVGRINEMKNIMQIIKSFKIISETSKLELIIVGDDKHKFDKFLDDACCNELTKKKIKFLQNVSNDKKYELMKEASVFLYPTLFEGFGFPPLEAMSCGCPVLVSNNSSLPEVCGNAAYYVDPCDENEIAKGIIEVFTNEALKAQLVERGFDRINMYSWEVAAAEHLIIIKSILYNLVSVSDLNSAFRKSFILRREKF